MNLRGKIALVTGASKRLGRAIALALFEQGATVALHYHTSDLHAHQLQDEISARGGNCELFKADLRDENACKRLIQEISEKLGAPEVIVNNASVYPEGSIDNAAFDRFSSILKLNAWAPFILAREMHLRSIHGAVVNILDARWKEIDLMHFEYTLSKKMLFHLTEIMAWEFAPGIRVNAVAPGPVLPPEGKTFQYLERITSTLPLGTSGNAEDVAEAVIFLIKNDAITGQVIYVDGGLHLRTKLWSRKK